jgi:hypothetical protein
MELVNNSQPYFLKQRQAQGRKTLGQSGTVPHIPLLGISSNEKAFYNIIIFGYIIKYATSKHYLRELLQ